MGCLGCCRPDELLQDQKCGSFAKFSLYRSGIRRFSDIHVGIEEFSVSLEGPSLDQIEKSAGVLPQISKLRKVLKFYDLIFQSKSMHWAKFLNSK